MIPDPAADRARSRFIAIQAMRWIGLAMVIVALLIINRRIDLPKEAGYLLFLFGLFDALIMPIILARRWKSPPE